jgi:proline racemase
VNRTMADKESVLLGARVVGIPAAYFAGPRSAGRLREGEVWRQEGIAGALFEGSIRVGDGELIPTLTGRAFVNGVATLILDPRDSYCRGISPADKHELG